MPFFSLTTTSIAAEPKAWMNDEPDVIIQQQVAARKAVDKKILDVRTIQLLIKFLR
jgi:hypothetical protein